MHRDQVIGIISTVKVREPFVEEYHRLLIDLIADHSTREPDCIDITVHRGSDDPARIMLFERWRVPSARFVAEQMSKRFIRDFTSATRHMVEADEEVTYWNATEVVARGERTELPGGRMLVQGLAAP